MSDVTISGTPIILWCLIRGNTTFFNIKIGRDNNISELKEIIKTKKKPIFDLMNLSC
jgi:hypothetical protein